MILGLIAGGTRRDDGFQLVGGLYLPGNEESFKEGAKEVACASDVPTLGASLRALC